MSVRHVSRSLAVVLLMLAACIAQADGQIRGMPLLQRFSPDDYQAAAGNLAVLAMPSGLLYVGNVEGLLRFDGSQWDRLELPRQSNVRALVAGRDGEIFVGGYDQFGVVREDVAGRMHYEDLRPAFGLDPKQVSFGTVWTVVRGERGVFFQTSSRLFFLADDGHHRQWPTSDEVRSLFVNGNELYARVHGKGLCRFADGEFELIPGGAEFAEQPLFNLMPHQRGLLLVGPGGFSLADADGIQPLPGDAGRIFAEIEPYSGLQLPDGGFVFGSDTGELLHFSADLQFKGMHRLGAFTVFALTRDHEGGIWAATGGDLIRLQVPAPWSQFAASEGLAGTIYDSAYHRGALWVATSQGVYRSLEHDGRTRFELAVETTLEASAMLSTEQGLLVGDRDGVLLATDAAEPQRLVESNAVFDMRVSKFDPDRVYVIADLELVALERDGQQWRLAHRWPFNGVSVAEFHEAAANEFWIGDYRSGVIRWRLDPDTGTVVERRAFGAAEGLLIDDEYGTVANMLDGDLYAISGRRVFRLQGSRFVEGDLAPFNLVERPWEIDIEQTPYGDYALTSRELWRRAPGDSEWRPVLLGSGVARGYYHVHVGADGMLRLITWNGLLQFDPGVPEVEPPPLAVGLRSLQRQHADGRIEALPINGHDAPIELPAGASLTLDMRLLSMESGSEFRLRVSGLIDRWTEWSPANTQLTMRNPGAGLYTIEVEGRTRSGRLATPLQLQVDAAPPWWLTSPALLLGLLAVLLIIAGCAHLVARIRYHQYLAINRRLEQKIAARTAELEAANRKLSELATEDSLTGVANRRALEQALLREWDRCRVLGQPLSVAMIDVDHFKQYNDVHGHLAGDQQLIRVARILATHVRPVRELLARFGGEEFALVLPGISIEDALQRAETVRSSFVGDSGPTISVGVASVIPNSRQVPDDLIRSADLALYAAKRAGRNRVMRAAPLLQSVPAA